MSADPQSANLLEALREARLAAAKRVEPFKVFHDSTLREMAVCRPTTDEEFLAIKGVGPAKLKKYGERFMEVIRKFGED